MVRLSDGSGESSSGDTTTEQQQSSEEADVQAVEELKQDTATNTTETQDARSTTTSADADADAVAAAKQRTASGPSTVDQTAADADRAAVDAAKQRQAERTEPTTSEIDRAAVASSKRRRSPTQLESLTGERSPTRPPRRGPRGGRLGTDADAAARVGVGGGSLLGAEVARRERVFSQGVDRVDEFLDEIAPGADVLAGSTDEATARAIDAIVRGDPAGVGDAVAGSTDEAVGEATFKARRGDFVGAGSALLGGVDEAAVDIGGGAVDTATAVGGPIVGGTREFVTDLASPEGREGFKQAAEDLNEIGEENLASRVRSYRLAIDAVSRGDTQSAIDIGVDQAERNIDDVSAAADIAAGSTDEFVGNAEFDSDVSESLTGEGGFLTEEEEGDLKESGKATTEAIKQFTDQDVPTPAAATSTLLFVDKALLLSTKAAEAATGQDVLTKDDTLSATHGGTTVTLFDEGRGPVEQTQRSIARGALFAANPFELASGAETGVEVAANLSGTVEEEGAGAVASTGAAFGRKTSESAAAAAKKDPTEFFGNLFGGFALGAGVGVTAGRAGRVLLDRKRTIGGTEIDLEDLTTEETAAFYRGGSGDKYPRATDPERFRRDQKGAIVEQAERQVPDVVKERFEQQGFDEGTIFQKALGGEPEGPGGGRSAQGFKGPDVDDDLARQYESPGTSFGPSFSPNFLRIGDTSRRTSLRPGLPDVRGGKPTGVFLKTDVVDTDAADIDEFTQELIDAEGDARVRTLPPDEATPKEAEVILPPGAEAADIGGSLSRRFLRNVGVGSDFFTKVEGRRVPLRPTVPTDKIDVDVDANTRNLLDDVRGSTSTPDVFDSNNRVFNRRTIRSLTRDSEVVDRPIPVVSSGGGGSSTPRDSNESRSGTVTRRDGGATGGRTPPGSFGEGSSGGPSGGGSSGGPSTGPGGSGGSGSVSEGEPSRGPTGSSTSRIYTPPPPPTTTSAGTGVPPADIPGLTRPTEFDPSRTEPTEFDAAFGRDFTKRFGFNVATPDEILGDSLDEADEPDESFVEPVDTDLSVVLTDVENLTGDELTEDLE